MTDILTFVADYRTLLGKSVLGMRVSDRDLQRLGALEHLLSEPASLPSSRRRTCRAGVYFPGALKIGGHTLRVTVTDLSAGGAGVIAPGRLRVGELAVVEVKDEVTGCEYRMPVRVAWTTSSGHAGLAFLGVPLELRRLPPSRALSRRADARECVV